MDARLVKKIAMITLLMTLLCTMLRCELVAFMGKLQQYLKRRKRLLDLIRLSGNQSISNIRANRASLHSTARDRRVWVRPGRTNLWWENILNRKVLDQEWKENFRYV